MVVRTARKGSHRRIAEIGWIGGATKGGWCSSQRVKQRKSRNFFPLFLCSLFLACIPYTMAKYAQCLPTLAHTTHVAACTSALATPFRIPRICDNIPTHVRYISYHYRVVLKSTTSCHALPHQHCLLLSTIRVITTDQRVCAVPTRRYCVESVSVLFLTLNEKVN